MQDIVYKPRAPSPGVTVTISVVPEGKALPGAEVKLLWLAPKTSDAPGSANNEAAARKDSKPLDLGKTDAEGILLWTPAKTGTAEIRVDHGELRLATHIEIYSKPSWIGWALPFAIAVALILWVTKNANRHAELRAAEEHDDPR